MMSKGQSNKQLRHSQQLIDYPSAFAVVSEYSVALAAAEIEKMISLHSPDFVLDWVMPMPLRTAPVLHSQQYFLI